MTIDQFKNYISRVYKYLFLEGSSTIPVGSTPEAIAGGNGTHLEKDEDIVTSVQKYTAVLNAYSLANYVEENVSPAERAEWDYKTKVGVAEALSKTKWPTVVMSGNSGQNTAMDVIALKQMTDLVDKMSK